jgi:carbonic anhydrase/acetyltransferase-like protein (isoleucine patch superfamily)
VRLASGDRRPCIHPTAWVAPGASVIGDVIMAEQASVWYAAVLRADTERISVGTRSNIQDGSVLHADPGHQLAIGAGVTVGHGARLHGCQIEDDVLIGIGAILLNGVTVGWGSLIGAGAVLTEGTIVPPRSLVLGMPGRVRRETSESELDLIVSNARDYADRAAFHLTEERPAR